MLLLHHANSLEAGIQGMLAFREGTNNYGAAYLQAMFCLGEMRELIQSYVKEEKE
jgi:hypothetical protein